ncbi:RNA polymerase sigma-70 factor, ECF subfamily [Limimonas halophila]|uniref:RNA polymerase sigma-70 factor, ECF subfamily n=1 Tax=Limimonas halophila TaxID=1082479 RepID=A0A1G7NXQ7_9PROT|nr:sigma-70 family RNA polymerase sigma factor [Limimonas halophila]SDF78868.1 RNA polymerase sigma-70 factor, ECF subfamily [Limimonas halophila]
MDRTGAEPTTSFADLLEAVAQRRDKQAFAALFSHFAPRVKAYLRRMGADDSLAEELAQDCLLTVWRRAHLFDRRQAGVSTWIFTIARNKRVDALRRERWPNVDPDDPSSLTDKSANADSVIEAAQREGRLREAVETLPQEQATLLRMAYFDEKSHSAIAAELELPLGTVKSRLRLALGRLKTCLEDIR